MPLTLDSIVRRTEGLMSAELGREIVILNPATDNYIGLDQIGSRVWDLLAAPGSVEDLCLRVTRNYRGNPREITADLIAFLNELDKECLLDVGDAAKA